MRIINHTYKKPDVNHMRMNWCLNTTITEYTAWRLQTLTTTHFPQWSVRLVQVIHHLKFSSRKSESELNSRTELTRGGIIEPPYWPALISSRQHHQDLVTSIRLWPNSSAWSGAVRLARREHFFAMELEHRPGARIASANKIIFPSRLQQGILCWNIRTWSSTTQHSLLRSKWRQLQAHFLLSKIVHNQISL